MPEGQYTIRVAPENGASWREAKTVKVFLTVDTGNDFKNFEGILKSLNKGN